MTYALYTIPGVQRFISSSRTTADVWGSSRAMSDLSGRAIAAAQAVGASVVMPAGTGALPNQILIDCSDLDPNAVIASVDDEVRSQWRVLGSSNRQGLPANPDHRLQTVAVSSPLSMPEAFDDLGNRLRERRRIRDFGRIGHHGGELCAVCGLEQQRHQITVGDGTEVLCTTCLHTRVYGQAGDSQDLTRTYPSTATIAAEPFRRAVVERWDDVREAAVAFLDAVDQFQQMPDTDVRNCAAHELLGRPPVEDERWYRFDGAMLWEEFWFPNESDEDLTILARQEGRSAVVACRRACTAADIESPNPYVAIFAADVDRLGRSIANAVQGADDAVTTLRAISSSLASVADRASEQADALMGRAVVAGGDDYLLFAPRATGLELAARIRDTVVGGLSADLPGSTLSGALVFAHHKSPLGAAIDRARTAVGELKSSDGTRGRLRVVSEQRNGERATVDLGWRTQTATVTALEELVDAFARGELNSKVTADLRRLHENAPEISRTHLDRYIARSLRRRQCPDRIADVLQLAASGDSVFDNTEGALAVARALAIGANDA